MKYLYTLLCLFLLLDNKKCFSVDLKIDQFLSDCKMFKYSFSNHKKKYPRPIEEYFSQRGQDKFLNEEIFKGKQQGIFVDIGAHDGISFSNTYYFEKNLNWSGLCIEPNPDIYQKLLQNRLCLCLQLGVSNKNEMLSFLKCSGYMLEMYSGILECMDPRHKERIKKEMALFGGSSKIIEIECKKLSDILESYNIDHINLLSIDVEGGEERVIQGIDFSRVIIDIIVIENNFNDSIVKSLLLSYGYKHIKKLDKDDIYQYQGVICE